MFKNCNIGTALSRPHRRLECSKEEIFMKRSFQRIPLQNSKNAFDQRSFQPFMVLALLLAAPSHLDQGGQKESRYGEEKAIGKWGLAETLMKCLRNQFLAMLDYFHFLYHYWRYLFARWKAINIWGGAGSFRYQGLWKRRTQTKERPDYYFGKRWKNWGEWRLPQSLPEKKPFNIE